MVRVLLKHPEVDASALQSFALRKSAENGHVDVVRLLLEDGRSDVTAHKNYALTYSAM